jgi:hypothetical protein
MKWWPGRESTLDTGIFTVPGKKTDVNQIVENIF